MGLLARIAAVVLLLAGAARAGDPLEDLAKKCGTPVETLRSVKAERALAPDVNTRRELLKEIAAKPRDDLLGLVVYMAENDKDVKTQIGASAVISCFALLADRDDVLRLVKPLCEKNIAKGQQFARAGMDELQRLNRWFRWDVEIAPVLKKVFEGEDFNLRSFAFNGICDLRHPRIVEELVKPSCWKVYNSLKVSLFDRRGAIRTLVDLADLSIIPFAAKNLTDDGHVAITSAWALVEMPVASTLPELRKVDSTAVHALRKPCWIARCLMDDPTCLDEGVKVAESRLEHAEIKRAFVAALGQMPSADKAKPVLEKLYASDLGEHVKLGAAMGLLYLGDARGIDLLEKKLLGPWPDDQSLRKQGHGWKMQLRFMDDILRIRNKSVGPLLVAMTKVTTPDRKDRIDKDGKENYFEWWRHGSPRDEILPDWYAEYVGDAICQMGELGLQDTMPRLKELSAFEEKIGHVKFHALVSRYELGDRGALKTLEKILPIYDDSLMRTIWVNVGSTEIRTERLKWSTIFDVCYKETRINNPEHLELLDLLLRTKVKEQDPMAEGWAKQASGGRELGGTVGRDERHPLEKPPEVTYLCRNQFVRRAIALASGKIGDAKAAKQLTRALRDSRAVVRAAALEEIGRISGKYQLVIGSSEPEEHQVFMTAVEWLKAQGAWPE